jgi:antagonist of KipI
MSILVQKAGILTTIQDFGRYGYRSLGVNPGGVMDCTAARLINILANNDETEAVLEMHFPAGEIVFESSAAFAIGGADFCPRLDEEDIENWRTYNAAAGTRLRFTGKTSGHRAYLAVCGGFAADLWLGSRSTNLAVGIGGYRGRKLQTGDRLEINHPEARSDLAVTWRISPSLIPRYSPFPTVRAVAGAEFDLLNEESSRLFESQNFTVSNNSDRMGFRLSGPPLSLKKRVEMVSAAVSFGTVQLLPDGQLIVLMADHQTAGGYPRIAHVIGRDLPLLAQLGGSDRVAFNIIGLAEAEALNAELERDIAVFRTGCRSTLKS